MGNPRKESMTRMDDQLTIESIYIYIYMYMYIYTCMYIYIYTCWVSIVIGGTPSSLDGFHGNLKIMFYGF